jgi:multiple sugar transport system substrate-binding protein
VSGSDEKKQTAGAEREVFMRLKRMAAVALSTIMMTATVLSGCGSKSATVQQEDPNAPVTVTFWAASVTEERQQFFDWFADYVHQVYPNITVDMLGVPGNLSDYRQKLDVAIQAGTAPDITNDFRPELITNGYYQNLNDYYNSWDGKDTINQDLITSNKTYDPSGTGLYALPYSSQTWNMWVRTDWLKSVGMGVPAKWSDFFTAIQKMTDKSSDKYGLAIRGGAGSANTLEMLMYAYSGITNYFDANGKSTINDPKNVEFVQKYLVDSYNTYTSQDDLTKGWSELANAFQSGKAGIVVHNLGSAKSMETAFSGDYSKFQAAVFPASDQGYVVHPGLMPLGLSMNSQSTHKDAVWKVMQLYLSKEVNTKYCELYGEIPANKEAAQDSFFTDSPYMSVGVKIETDKNIKFNDTPYYLPTYSNIQTDMESNIQAVMAGKMTPKQMLDKWAAALEEAYSDYHKQVGK